jgi:membrane-bound lytic murein transglycosylase D
MNISREIQGRLISILLIFILTCTGNVYGYSNIPVEHSEVNNNDDLELEIKSKIQNVVSIVSPKYNAYVKSYLRTYLELHPGNTEIMLGRTGLYFPLFEKMLAENNMPDDLKYLSIVESSLNPIATSSAGAAGLWQFMRPTGREYGLQVTKYVDERRDPEKSTKAAITYLKKLYNRFGSWELAMAAYNAGPGRVNSAVKRAGSHDYWKVSRFLPRETRAYVPGFIAASYVANYYGDHGLIPEQPARNLSHTQLIKVYNGISFSEINKITGVPFKVIKQLNPTYSRNYIPRSVYGYVLQLPESVSQVFLNEIDDPASAHMVQVTVESPDLTEVIQFEEKLVMHEYLVVRGDNLTTISNVHQCTIDELRKWNNLNNSNLAIGQSLKIYRTERVALLPQRSLMPAVEALPSIPVNPLPVKVAVVSCPKIDPALISLPEKARFSPKASVALRRRQSVRNLKRRNNIKLKTQPTQTVVLPGSIFFLD